VIGGEHSGCDETTTECFIECALFDPVRIALSGRRHDVRTDARSRFERGIDPSVLPKALDAAARMIIELCGGEASDVAEAGAEPAWARQATLRFARIAELGGLDLPREEAVRRLTALGLCTLAEDAASVTVAVPPWRNDIAGHGMLAQDAALPADRARAAAEGCAAIEPECDLVEEVLRLGGLDSVPAVSLPVAVAVPRPALSPRQARSALARRVSERLGRRLGVDDVIAGVRSGRIDATDALDATIDHLAVAVGAVVNIFNPATLFVHGALLSAAHDAFTRLLDRLPGAVLKPSYAACTIVRARGSKRTGAVAGIVDHVTAGLFPRLEAGS
jgi:phenylalanyl-tRNA synthetase beta chain